ncbi:hypothetical protein [Aquamicrobium soli]|jgi:hypothetical protein|uniref:Transposase n=1 Tax=Aquamicrobium soli TaxID=1811518 RepID=A0ABV7K9L6_9HYPH
MFIQNSMSATRGGIVIAAAISRPDSTCCGCIAIKTGRTRRQYQAWLWLQQPGFVFCSGPDRWKGEDSGNFVNGRRCRPDILISGHRRASGQASAAVAQNRAAKKSAPSRNGALS